MYTLLRLYPIKTKLPPSPHLVQFNFKGIQFLHKDRSGVDLLRFNRFSQLKCGLWQLKNYRAKCPRKLCRAIGLQFVCHHIKDTINPWAHEVETLPTETNYPICLVHRCNLFEASHYILIPRLLQTEPRSHDLKRPHPWSNYEGIMAATMGSEGGTL